MAEPSFPVRLFMEKCADYVEQVLLPKVTDPLEFNKTYLMCVALRIMANSVEEKAIDLIKENAEMRALFKAVLEELKKYDPLPQSAIRNQLIQTLNDALKATRDGPTDPAGENLILKQALVDTIKGLDALTDVIPESAISSLRSRMRSVLKQQVDHGWTHLEGVPLGF